MKKIIKLFTCLLIIVTLSGCGSKKALKSNDIKNKLSNLGFTINDVTSYMEDKNIKNVITANNGKYQIEFYTFDSKKDAKKAYETNVKNFSINKKNKKEKHKDNYDKFTQELSDTYNMVIRLNNTLLYSSINLEYKRDLNKTIKNLGY